MDFENSCPICESKTESPQSVCPFCGYNLGNQIIDTVKLKNYMAIIKSSKDWAKEITLKKNLIIIRHALIIYIWHATAFTNQKKDLMEKFFESNT